MSLYTRTLATLLSKNIFCHRTLIRACFHSRFSDSLSFEDLEEMSRKKNKGGQKQRGGGGHNNVNKNVANKVIGVPTEIYLVVIGTGGPGSSRALLVTHQYKKYLFNCGEGTQRLGSTSKSLRAASNASLKGLQNIFFTHKSWENVGGLMSMAMTLESHNKLRKSHMLKESHNKLKDNPDNINLNIHGPKGIDDIILFSRKFEDNASTRIVKCHGDYNDDQMIIRPIQFHATSNSESSNGDAEQSSEPDTKRQRLNTPSKVPSTDTACAYICTAAQIRPKINMEKVYEAGIQVGSDIGKLQNGKNVTLADGSVVTPDMVTEVVSTNERPFLVVECPNKNFLPSLVAEPGLQFYQKPELKDSLSLIVHMTPADVYNMEGYQTWMKGFSSSTNHLVLNKEAAEADMVRTRMHQSLLNMVDNVVFPLLPEVNEPMMTGLTSVSEGEEEAAEEVKIESGCTDVKSISHGQEEASEEGKIVFGCTGQFYCYRGHKKGFNIAQDESIEEFLKNYTENPEVMSELNKLRESLPREDSESKANEEENESEASDLNLSYPRVVFLGTGSAEGQKLRSQSCILVQLSKHNIILLDCGENSYGQLFRFYGQKKAGQVLRKLKAIFVSHMHADHHQGLFTLLKERKVAFEEKGVPFEPALVMAPIQMRPWIMFYESEVEPIGHLLRLCHHQEKMKPFDDSDFIDVVTQNEVRKELQLNEYKTVQVTHTRNSYAVVLKHKNGFRLTYSGDCRPSDKLAAVGENSDLLIHEATHEDALEDMAKFTKHSTFSEALSVGKKMKAKHIILTHFSQRYAYSVPIEEVHPLPTNVGIAFDNMEVCPNTLTRLPKLIPALSAVFSEDLEKLKLYNLKRDMRQKLQQDDLSNKLEQQQNDLSNKLEQQQDDLSNKLEQQQNDLSKKPAQETINTR